MATSARTTSTARKAATQRQRRSAAHRWRRLPSVCSVCPRVLMASLVRQGTGRGLPPPPRAARCLPRRASPQACARHPWWRRGQETRSDPAPMRGSPSSTGAHVQALPSRVAARPQTGPLQRLLPVSSDEQGRSMRRTSWTTGGTGAGEESVAHIPSESERRDPAPPPGPPAVRLPTDAATHARARLRRLASLEPAVPDGWSGRRCALRRPRRRRQRPRGAAAGRPLRPPAGVGAAGLRRRGRRRGGSRGRVPRARPAPSGQSAAAHRRGRGARRAGARRRLRERRHRRGLGRHPGAGRGRRGRREGARPAAPAQGRDDPPHRLGQGRLPATRAAPTPSSSSVSTRTRRASRCCRCPATCWSTSRGTARTR